MYGWYFGREDGKSEIDRSVIELGATHKVAEASLQRLVGLRASKRILDALRYAPPPPHSTKENPVLPSYFLYRVQLGGKIEHGEDISYATERTYLQKVECTQLLRRFVMGYSVSLIALRTSPGLSRYINENSQCPEIAGMVLEAAEAWPRSKECAEALAKADARTKDRSHEAYQQAWKELLSFRENVIETQEEELVMLVTALM